MGDEYFVKCANVRYPLLRRIVLAADHLGLNQKQLTGYVNSERFSRRLSPELLGPNRGHKFEKPGTGLEDYILKDMREFLGEQ